MNQKELVPSQETGVLECCCPCCKNGNLQLRDRPVKNIEELHVERWYHAMPKMIGALSVCIIAFLISIWAVVALGFGHWLWVVMTVGVIVTLSVVIVVDRQWEFKKQHWLICTKCGWSQRLARG